jgi:hypothetical protein
MVPILKIALMATNFSLFTFIVSLVVDHIQQGNNLLSFVSVFHALTLCWLLLRGVFWLMTVIHTATDRSSTFFALYWLANPVEFGSFLLVPLFFTQVLYPTSWKKYWGAIRFGYIAVVAGLVLFQALWIVWTAMDLPMCETATHGWTACFHTELMSNMFRAITAGCFLFLAVTQGAYGYQLMYVDPRLHERYLISSPTLLAGVNAALVVSFLSRGLYQLLSIFRVCMLPDVPLEGQDDVSIVIVLCFLLWDYLPALLVVATITSTTLGNGTGAAARRHSWRAKAWEWTRERTALNAVALQYPEYGAVLRMDDEEVPSLVGSYVSEASGSASDRRSQTAMWIITQSAPVDICSLKRCDLSCLYQSPHNPPPPPPTPYRCL